MSHQFPSHFALRPSPFRSRPVPQGHPKIAHPFQGWEPRSQTPTSPARGERIPLVQCPFLPSLATCCSPITPSLHQSTLVATRSFKGLGYWSAATTLFGHRAAWPSRYSAVRPVESSLHGEFWHKQEITCYGL